MKFVNVLRALTVALLLARPPAFAEQYRFEPDCTLPYEAIKQAHPIDEVCNVAGESEDYAPNSQAQRRANEAKNQLCAPARPYSSPSRTSSACRGELKTPA